jgi:8-oxo-dGTP pyrophosphatase MutT (NUDIX family)
VAPRQRRNPDYANRSGEAFWGDAGAGVLPIARSTGRILVGLRSAYVNEPHTWGVFGGAIDASERPTDAARRELCEELGYCGPIKLVKAYVFESPGGGFRYTNYLGIVEDEFQPDLDWETEGAQWVTLEELRAIEPKHFGLEALLEHSGSLVARHVRTRQNPLNQRQRAAQSSDTDAYQALKQELFVADAAYRAHKLPEDDISPEWEAEEQRLHAARKAIHDKMWTIGRRMAARERQSRPDAQLAYEGSYPDLIGPTSEVRGCTRGEPFTERRLAATAGRIIHQSCARGTFHHLVYVLPTGVVVAGLTIKAGPKRKGLRKGTIDRVYTDPEQRRKGYARELLASARSSGIFSSVGHSDDLTGMGRKWKGAVNPYAAGWR